MEIGVTLRNMGPQSTVDTMVAGAQAAEALGFESIWITDHIAIPPDDAEGSGGRYLDPLVSLAFLAGETSSIRLGTGVLILPYRPALPTVKQIATLQELSRERLLLGVGIGWMDAEFRALDVERRRRGAISDGLLEFLNQCFANDTVTANGQPFLFKPRPAKPPVYVGGAAPHALERAARLGDGWLPMARSPDGLGDAIAAYRERTDALGRAPGRVTVISGVPVDDADEGRRVLDGYSALGIERLVCGLRYDTADEYQRQLEALAALR